MVRLSYVFNKTGEKCVEIGSKQAILSITQRYLVSKRENYMIVYSSAPSELAAIPYI